MSCKTIYIPMTAKKRTYIFYFDQDLFQYHHEAVINFLKRNMQTRYMQTKYDNF